MRGGRFDLKTGKGVYVFVTCSTFYSSSSSSSIKINYLSVSLFCSGSSATTANFSGYLASF